MHWSLDQLRDLDADEYDELIAWAEDRSERSKGEDGSVDMDAVIAAKKARDDQDG